MGDRVRINTQVSPETKRRLEHIGGGPRRLGVAIELLLNERDELRLQVKLLEAYKEGLEDRLKGLGPTDLP